uniref:Tetratricopeptide repeat domain 21A n=1 Tax=Macaca fascicularis TaxID=9541 RepID=A0A7N9CRT2_MACFA
MAAAPLGIRVHSRFAYPGRPGATSTDSLSRRSIPAPCDVKRFVPPTPDTDAPSNRLAAPFPRTVTPSTARRDRVPTTLPRESHSAPPHQTRTRSRERPEMSSNDSSLMAGIIYYSQEKYFHHVQQTAAVGLEKFSNDPVLKFFKAYGVLKEEHIQDAISDLESIRHHPDVSLCSTMALIYAHKRCEIIDREAIQELEYSLKEIRKTVSGTALYYAGVFLWLIGHHDKAKEYIDRMLKISRGFREAYVLRGWVDLTSDKPHTAKKAIEYLEQGIQDTKDVLGLMGKAMYFMMQQNYSEALEVVNQITVTSGSFLPALVLKMQLFLARQDWEQTVEMGHRILEKDESNIDACQILAVHELAREGNMTTCGSHQVILGLVCSFIERTFMATPSYIHVATELGYFFILKNQVKEALLWYTEAMKLDKDGMAGLTGIILCHILEGHLEEAEHQLEFLKEVQKSLGKSEVLIFLQALLTSKKHKGEQETTALLKEAVELHFSSMQGLPLGSEYFEKLDPYFLVCIAKEYLLFCPKQPRLPGQIVSPLLKQVAVILNPVVKAAPALIDPLYLMAQVRRARERPEHLAALPGAGPRLRGRPSPHVSDLLGSGQLWHVLPLLRAGCQPQLPGPRSPPLPPHQGQGSQQGWRLSRSHKDTENGHQIASSEEGRRQEVPRALSADQPAGIHLIGTGGGPPAEWGASKKCHALLPGDWGTLQAQDRPRNQVLWFHPLFPCAPSGGSV